MARTILLRDKEERNEAKRFSLFYLILLFFVSFLLFAFLPVYYQCFLIFVRLLVFLPFSLPFFSAVVKDERDVCVDTSGTAVWLADHLVVKIPLLDPRNDALNFIWKEISGTKLISNCEVNAVRAGSAGPRCRSAWRGVQL